MGLLDKVRDFFYDEEIEEEIPKKKIKNDIKPKKEKIIFDKPKEEKRIKHDKIEKQEISERELFKAERTFNFPLDVNDEDYVNEEKKEEKVVIKEKPIVEKPKSSYKESKTISIRNYSKYEKEPEEVETKKFKPTPVISPIYGILDKNYKKEDILIDSNTSKSETRKVDYETVRKRAYSNAYVNETDNNEKESDAKDIFYNLEKEEKEEDVKIVYNDVDIEEEKEDDRNKTIGEKIEEYEKSLEENNDKEEESDENILSETKEQDLFNLIDNMYNSDEEDEEEE